MITAAVIAGVVVFAMGLHRALCPTWVVEHLFASCGSLDAGGMDIVATNLATGQVFYLASSGLADDAQLSVDAEKRLIIAVVDRTDLGDILDEFGGVKVVYKFDPDAPEKNPRR